MVIAGPPGRIGSDPGAVRISSVDKNSFDIRFVEPNYQDGDHTAEKLSYLVVEAGRWQLPDGTILEAGTQKAANQLDEEFERVEFSSDFDSAPIVLSQIQTENADGYAVARMSEIDKGGFGLAMQKEEVQFNLVQEEESLGFVAIDQGVHAFRGIDFQAEKRDGINSDGGSLRFDDVFDGSEPLLFAAISSFNGSDPVGLRIDRINDDRARVLIEEERSFDDEVFHTKESIDFLVIDGPGRIVIEESNILSA